MTRRRLFWLPVCAAFARAQSRFPGAPYREYARCLPDYLRGLALRACEARNREIARLTSAAAIRARQEWVRDTFWKLAGGMPQRTPLHVRTVGGFERPGYRLEKLVYESVPGFFISANLYIPTGITPPFPGVLFQMGHTRNGKAGETYQRCCQGLARLGYLVLGFDPMGQGERVYYPDASGYRSRLASPDSEHTVPGRQMLLNGDSATRMQVWDAVRSLDVLAAHPQVDARRLASTGQSGGGTVTMLLAAVDDRLAAAAVASGNTENVACPNFDPPGATDDAEQNLVGSGPLGFDRWDLLYPLAPKPLLISVSDMDFFHTYSPDYIRNGWEEFQKLQAVYKVLGAADQLSWTDTPLPHALAYDSRMRIYRWFGRWLKHDASPVAAEPATEPEKDETLWVTETGSVVRSFHSRTPFELNRAREIAVRPKPLGPLIGAVRPAPGVRFRTLGRADWAGVAVEAVEVPSAPGVWLPAWLCLPAERDRSKPVLLAVEPGGRNRRWQEGGLYHSLARRGYAVCAADLRGVGDLTPEVGRGAAGYAREHDDEENYAWASLILGVPLLGQRVTDLLALAAALRQHAALRGSEVKLAASGRLTAPALCAAAMDTGIAELYLAGALVSYRSVVETERYTAPFGNFVFGIREYTDLPEVAASLAPRRVALAGTVDAAGNTLPVSAVREIYRGQHIVVRPESRWDLEALA
ncbi:MAG TPA: acetylxylan esterase [Bryobacteraceae bacterium]|nr:acetylxylan esterase [Bryobacteraceae bacterium]